MTWWIELNQICSKLSYTSLHDARTVASPCYGSDRSISCLSKGLERYLNFVAEFPSLEWSVVSEFVSGSDTTHPNPLRLERGRLLIIRICTYNPMPTSRFSLCEVFMSQQFRHFEPTQLCNYNKIGAPLCCQTPTLSLHCDSSTTYTIKRRLESRYRP